MLKDFSCLIRETNKATKLALLDICIVLQIFNVLPSRAFISVLPALGIVLVRGVPECFGDYVPRAAESHKIREPIFLHLNRPRLLDPVKCRVLDHTMFAKISAYYCYWLGFIIT
jgi:hypothetical protein